MPLIQVGVFRRLAEELGELLDIKDPDSLTHRQRREAAEATEAAKFDSDHYLCDLYESEEIDHILRFFFTYFFPYPFDIKEQFREIFDYGTYLLGSKKLPCDSDTGESF